MWRSWPPGKAWRRRRLKKCGCMQFKTRRFVQTLGALKLQPQAKPKRSTRAHSCRPSFLLGASQRSLLFPGRCLCVSTRRERQSTWRGGQAVAAPRCEHLKTKCTMNSHTRVAASETASKTVFKTAFKAAFEPTPEPTPEATAEASAEENASAHVEGHDASTSSCSRSRITFAPSTTSIYVGLTVASASFFLLDNATAAAAAATCAVGHALVEVAAVGTALVAGGGAGRVVRYAGNAAVGAGGATLLRSSTLGSAASASALGLAALVAVSSVESAAAHARAATSGIPEIAARLRSSLPLLPPSPPSPCARAECTHEHAHGDACDVCDVCDVCDACDWIVVPDAPPPLTLGPPAASTKDKDKAA